MKEFYKIRRKIIKWFEQNGRDFPWRHTGDPYKIMVAEFMLHRTKAEQVVPVYIEFLNKYPDINSLANATEEEIKLYTKSLGLHWRYKHFLESASYINNNFNRKIPDSIDELIKIPGVGEYIACAIRIIAFNKTASIIDSNIARFINRFYGLNLSGEIRRKRIIKEKSKTIFNTKNVRRFLFAILDFCYAVCKSQNPECYKCIINNECKFNKHK